MKGRRAIVRSFHGLVACLSVILLLSCNTDENNPLAPYGGGRPNLTSVTVEDSVFVPRVLWLGGYVSAFGVNRGHRACLDTSLVWMIHASGNGIHYPAKFGALPAGATDMTTNFGGTFRNLVEDAPYTFWVMKEDVWDSVAAHPGKALRRDTLVVSGVQIRGDTIAISPLSYASRTDTIDAYVNISSFDARGWLVNNVINLSIKETDTSNTATIRFTPKSSGIVDTLMTAMGLVVNSGVYTVNNVVWEVLTVDTVSGKPVYRTRNSIGSPLLLGQSFPGTATFTSFPVRGLERNRIYYFWLAQKSWDGVSRDSRTVPYYSWMTFHTW